MTNVRSTLVARPGLELIISRADPYPEGIGPAFERIESRLSSLRGRRFYGVTFDREEGIEYFAAVVPQAEGEAAALGLETLTVAPGPWARTRLSDWQEDPGQIADLVDALIAKHGRDDARPVLEFYRSRTEVDVLVPTQRPPEVPAE